MPNKPAKSSKRQQKKIFHVYIEESYLRALTRVLIEARVLWEREYMKEWKQGRLLELSRLISDTNSLKACLERALYHVSSPLPTGMVGLDRAVVASLNRIKRNENGARTTRPVPEPRPTRL